MTAAGARGTLVLRYARRVLHEETYERVIVPAIADLQHECAASAALTVRLRAYWGVARVIALCLVGDGFRDRDHGAGSLARRTAFLLPVPVLLLMLPVAQSAIAFGARFGVLAGIVNGALLTPPNILLGLPPAFFLAICVQRVSRDSGSARVVPGTIVGSCICAAIVFAMIMVIVPLTNQASRSHMANTFRRYIPDTHFELRPGMADMTWSALNDHIRHAPRRRAEAQARAHRRDRLAFVGSVFVFGLLGLGIVGRWRSRVATISAALGLLIAYGASFTVGAGMLARSAGLGYEAWVANGVFVIVGAALLASRNVPPYA